MIFWYQRKKKTKHHPASGEEALAILIKEAGEEARKRKKGYERACNKAA